MDVPFAEFAFSVILLVVWLGFNFILFTICFYYISRAMEKMDPTLEEAAHVFRCFAIEHYGT